MKKSVGIGIGIVIVATLIIVAFSNIDDMVSTNVEETSSQIADNLDEIASEIKFTNPLQAYEVDSQCELAYVIRDNLENNKAPFKADLEYIGNVQKVEFEKKSNVLLEEYGDAMRLDPELMKQKNLELFDELQQLLVDYTMEYNSIHPKLRESVDLVLSDKVFHPETGQEKIKILDIMYLIEPQSYQEDPTCGKKFHERFGDETFNVLKQMYGEDGAQKKYDTLKKIIYEN